MLKVAVIGRTQWLYETAKYLTKNGYIIPLIVTARAAPEYTKKEGDFERLASEIGAKFYLLNSLDNPSLLEDMKCLDIDIGVSINWINIIQQRHIDYFRLGILNAHLGDLPRYRGNACANWAIINGESEVALSIHLMEGGKLDCGRIIVQDKFPISENTYIGDIYTWAEQTIPNLFLDALRLLEKDPNYTLKYAEANSPFSLRCYPRRPEDSRIYWNKSAKEIHRLIRASSKPFNGAYCFLDGEKIVILRAEIYYDTEKYCAIPGQISEISENYFIVITDNGKLKITEWECNKKVKSIRQRLK